MKPRDIDQKIQRLLEGKLPAEQIKQLRGQLRNIPANSDDFELYRSVERKLSQLPGDTDIKDWDTQLDSIRTAMERDALLGQAKRPVSRRIFRAAVAAAVIIAAVSLLPSGLKWLAEKTPVPASSPIEIQWAYQSPAIQTGDIQSSLVAPVSSPEAQIQLSWLDNAQNNPAGVPTSAAIIVIIKPQSPKPTIAQTLCSFGK